MSDAYVGIDIGGSTLKGARLDASGSIAERVSESLSTSSGEDLLAQVARVVVTLRDGAADRVAGVGVGVPGIVDRATGRVRVSPTVPVLNGVDVAAEVARRTGLPAFADNDANASALAEALRGAGRGARDLLYLTLRTGIGAGLVLNGRIYSGRSGFAGEIGHIQVDPRGVACGCGLVGCVETVAGVKGWLRRAEAALATRHSSLKGRPLDPVAITEAARAGDAVALDVVDGTARALAVGIAAALQLLDVEKVVVGGGVAAAGPFLLDRIAAETRRRVFAHVYEDCTFALGELGHDAGVIGAGCLAVVGG